MYLNFKNQLKLIYFETINDTHPLFNKKKHFYISPKKIISNYYK
jgi:hypothetical protein